MAELAQHSALCELFVITLNWTHGTVNIIAASWDISNSVCPISMHTSFVPVTGVQQFRGRWWIQAPRDAHVGQSALQAPSNLQHSCLGHQAQTEGHAEA